MRSCRIGVLVCVAALSAVCLLPSGVAAQGGGANLAQPAVRDTTAADTGRPDTTRRVQPDTAQATVATAPADTQSTLKSRFIGELIRSTSSFEAGPSGVKVSNVPVWLLVILLVAAVALGVISIRRKQNTASEQGSGATATRIASITAASALALLLGLSGFWIGRWQVQREVGPGIDRAFATLERGASDALTRAAAAEARLSAARDSANTYRDSVTQLRGSIQELQGDLAAARSVPRPGVITQPMLQVIIGVSAVVLLAVAYAALSFWIFTMRGTRVREAYEQGLRKGGRP